MTTAQGKIMAPRFEVDPLWPKPLPNRWYIGSTIGVAVDAQDHIWIVHRPDTLTPNEAAADLKTGSCCSKAPPVLEFDQAGNLIGHWGGPGQGYEWPDSNHGITIDYKGNVWIGGNGIHAADQGQDFTRLGLDSDQGDVVGPGQVDPLPVSGYGLFGQLLGGRVEGG
ncbi:MAG: hypothetical protein L0220_21580, partial [Acidobacteria bacterium]|nr:hypothetical protein [Acidobacteriota bacterium]